MSEETKLAPQKDPYVQFSPTPILMDFKPPQLWLRPQPAPPKDDSR